MRYRLRRRRFVPTFESLEFRRLLCTHYVTSEADTGNGSLRELFEDSIAQSGDTVCFRDNVNTISLADVIIVSSGVTIDGQQDRTDGDRVSLMGAGVPCEESDYIDNAKGKGRLKHPNDVPLATDSICNVTGSQVETQLHHGLRLLNDTSITGMHITGFNSAIFVTGNNNRVFSNVLGIDQGNGAGNNTGVLVFGDENDIGLSAQGNQINGSRVRGVDLSASLSNRVIGNTLVGIESETNGSAGIAAVDASDSTISGNSIREHDAGVFIVGASQTIGNRILNNQISDNTGSGVFAASNGNRISGNSISGNSQNGIYLIQAEANQVVNNTVSNSGASYYGIQVSDGANNLIGTLDEDGCDVPYNENVDAQFANIVTGNGNFGISVDSGSHGNRVCGNVVGVDATFEQSIPNGGGITVGHSWDNQVSNNLLKSNWHAGILVRGPTATRNTITDNEVRDSREREGNDAGILVDTEAHGNWIGMPGAGNIIDNNAGPGILIGIGASNNQVTDNTVNNNRSDGISIFSTNNQVTMNTVSGNNNHGVAVYEADNVIGGTFDTDGNTITGNVEIGVYIQGLDASNNRVAGNRIGVDTDDNASPNGRGVLLLNASLNSIGEFLEGSEIPDYGKRNVISGNSFGNSAGNDFGMLLTEGSANNIIVGNYIGTDSTATSSVANVGRGVIIDNDSHSNRILHNVIGGNDQDALQLNNIVAGGNEVRGNFIGVNRESVLIENGGHAIRISGSSQNNFADNHVASDRDEQDYAVRISGNQNVFSNNEFSIAAGMAISVDAGQGNLIRENAFTIAGGQAIDIGGDGVTPNDVSDLDGGPNDSLNRPDNLTVLLADDGSLRFRADVGYGVLSAFPMTFDLYLGEGTRRVPIATFVCQNAPNEACDVDSESGLLESVWAQSPVNGTLSPGDKIYAVATDNIGNTSEFSDVAILIDGITPDVIDFPLQAVEKTFADTDARRKSDLVLSTTQSFSGNLNVFGDRDLFQVTITPIEGNPVAGTIIVDVGPADENVAVRGSLKLQVLELTGSIERLVSESSGESDEQRISFPITNPQLADDPREFGIVVEGLGGEIHSGYTLDLTLSGDDLDSDGLLDTWERDGAIVKDKVEFATAPSLTLRDLFVEVDSMNDLAPAELIPGNDLWNDISALEQPGNLGVPLRELTDTILDMRSNPQAYPAIQLTDTVLDLVIAAFWVGPKDASDRIVLHIECRGDVEGSDVHAKGCDSNIPRKAFDSWSDFEAKRNQHFGTFDQRSEWTEAEETAKRNGYRYAMFGYQIANSSDFGRASVKSNDFAITLGLPEDRGLNPAESRVDAMKYGLYQAGVFMHELGHTLSLSHEEGGLQPRDYKSVMNYFWIVPTDDILDAWELSYSQDPADEQGTEEDEWNQLLFQFTYSDLISQEHAEGKGQPCASFDGESAKSAPADGTLIDMIDYIHIPHLFQPEGESPQTYRCRYYGSEIPFEIDFPFFGSLAMTIRIPEPNADDSKEFKMQIVTPDDQQVTISEAEPFSYSRDLRPGPLSSVAAPTQGERDGLDQGIISDRIGVAFAQSDTVLSPDAEVEVISPSSEWRIRDKGQLFELRTERESLNIYKPPLSFRILKQEIEEGVQGLPYELTLSIDQTGHEAENVEAIRRLLRDGQQNRSIELTGDPKFDLDFDIDFDIDDVEAFFEILDDQGTPLVSGDSNADGQVNGVDLKTVVDSHLQGALGNWSTGDFVSCTGLYPDCDFAGEEQNRLGDGHVTSSDLAVFATRLQEVPEYCSAAYVALVGSTCDTAGEIDRLHQYIRGDSYSLLFDIRNASGATQSDHRIDINDRDAFLSNVGIRVGDSNLDGLFNSSDLVAVLARGEYEDGIIGNSSWMDGDWNGDGEFDSSDFVHVFPRGEYELAAAGRALPPGRDTIRAAHLLDPNDDRLKKKPAFIP